MPYGKFNGVNFKPIFFNESFSPRRRLFMLLRAGGQQIQRVIVGLNPVITDSSGI